MSYKIYKKDDNIIFEIPFWTKRSNPYMPGEYVGEHPTLIGMVYREKSGEDMIGFAEVIDMSYKDKPDQETGIIYHYLGGEDNFIELCKELKIEVIKYLNCAYCGEPLFGSYTMGDKGEMCFSCQLEERDKK